MARQCSVERSAATRRPDSVPSDPVSLEKNLTSLGFFTPSSCRIKQAKAKVVAFTHTRDGRRCEATATILPAALYGLPVTSDLDKYLALQTIVTDLRGRGRTLSNPVSFTSAQLLGVLGTHKRSGRNYEEVSQWLDLMTATTIVSEEAVYFAGRRKFARDRFKVFERAVSVGQQLDDGRTADRNYVWFSEWQLENINSDYVIPVDFESYRRMKNNIAKTLVPLLQIWLYASRAEGRFEKRYDELCQLLDVRRYEHRSKIVEKLGPSLDELQAHGYLSGWGVESTTSDKQTFKLILRHGERFNGAPRIARASAYQHDIPHQGAAPGGVALPARPHEVESGSVPSGVDADLFKGLTGRGIAARKAQQLLSKVTAEQQQRVALQLAWGDHLIAQALAGTYRNPPGFYVHLVENDVAPPPDFASALAARAGDDSAPPNPACEAQSGKQQITDLAADEAELDRQVEALGDEERQSLIAEVRAAFFAAHPYTEDWPREVLDRVLAGALRSAVGADKTTQGASHE